MRRRQFITAGRRRCGVAARGAGAAAGAAGGRIPQCASPDLTARLLRAFRSGLSQTGYIEGQNVRIEYRWAEGQNDRLPALAADLVRSRVAVIAATGSAVLPAKAATTGIPIVFDFGSDPVESGLVASLSRPGGNVTGVTSLGVEVGPKRLELLHELIPAATTVALLVNPAGPNADSDSKAMTSAAGSLGLQLQILNARTERDLEMIFARLSQSRERGLVINPDRRSISIPSLPRRAA